MARKLSRTAFILGILIFISIANSIFHNYRIHHISVHMHIHRGSECVYGLHQLSTFFFIQAILGREKSNISPRGGKCF